MHDAPETWQGRNEKVSKDWRAYRITGFPVREQEALGWWTGNVRKVKRSVLFTLRLVPTGIVGTCFKFLN